MQNRINIDKKDLTTFTFHISRKLKKQLAVYAREKDMFISDVVSSLIIELLRKQR